MNSWPRVDKSADTASYYFLILCVYMGALKGITCMSPARTDTRLPVCEHLNACHLPTIPHHCQSKTRSSSVTPSSLQIRRMHGWLAQIGQARSIISGLVLATCRAPGNPCGLNAHRL